jgi:hypothetical protein
MRQQRDAQQQQRTDINRAAAMAAAARGSPVVMASTDTRGVARGVARRKRAAGFIWCECPQPPQLGSRKVYAGRVPAAAVAWNAGNFPKWDSAAPVVSVNGCTLNR